MCFLIRFSLLFVGCDVFGFGMVWLVRVELRLFILFCVVNKRGLDGCCVILKYYDDWDFVSVFKF